MFFDVKPDCKIEQFELIKIKDFEIDDMALLAMQYSYDIVIDAYCTIYKSYILKNKIIKNLGGLIRTVIKAKLNNSL